MAVFQIKKVAATDSMHRQQTSPYKRQIKYVLMAIEVVTLITPYELGYCFILLLLLSMRKCYVYVCVKLRPSE